eukprot:755161-Hanusia_phi.AAC.10
MSHHCCTVRLVSFNWHTPQRSLETLQPSGRGVSLVIHDVNEVMLDGPDVLVRRCAFRPPNCVRALNHCG